MLANSGSNIVVIPPELAEKIGAKVLDKEELIEVGGGILIKGVPALIQLEVEDPESGEWRKEEIVAYVVPGQKTPLLGTEGLDKLGIIINTRRCEYKLEKL